MFWNDRKYECTLMFLQNISECKGLLSMHWIFINSEHSMSKKILFYQWINVYTICTNVFILWKMFLLCWCVDLLRKKFVLDQVWKFWSTAGTESVRIGWTRYRYQWHIICDPRSVWSRLRVTSVHRWSARLTGGTASDNNMWWFFIAGINAFWSKMGYNGTRSI